MAVPSALAIAWGLAVPIFASADEFDGPSFRLGMWEFERTLEHTGSLAALPRATFLTREQTARCVDPTQAMRETFRSSDVGNCHSAKPEKLDNRYIFSLRCDVLGPVRTEIAVESDAAYTEVNELLAGKFKRRETVVAHRIGDCESDSMLAIPAIGSSAAKSGKASGSHR
jgi:hypothetical protein